MTERILVIEDNEDNIRLIDYLLKAHGYAPLLARDGREGVRLAIEGVPDVVLLDIRMPGMDGYEVAAALKAEPGLAGARVVAVTASAMVGDREQIAAAGFDGYIQKPIDPETFIAEVECWLPERASPADASTTAAVASILVLDDRAVERELLEVVLGSAGYAVLQAANGEDALALARDEHPDVIIADILMPGMDGYEFVRALRADPASASTRVILCTATYEEDDVRRLALACGVSHVLIKPVEAQEILQVVQEILSTEPGAPRLEPAERFGREQLRAANAKLIEQVAALERAEEIRHLLATIVESSDDAIIAKTLDGTIVSWNRGAEDLYGYTAGEAIGKSIAMLVPLDRPDDLPAILEEIKRGEVAHRLETVRVRKDGSAIDVALTISPIYSDAGELTGAATIARDISVRKQADRDLALAHRTAVELARAKSEFVTNISHEIRTPLNGVVGMTGLLGDTALDQLQHEYVDALQDSSEALLAVIEDVLDFSKLEAGNLQLAPIDFNLREALEEVLAMLAGPAQAKDLQISLFIDADVPAAVRGDRARLRQVLLNLLSNAVKFTASGEVQLHVDVENADRLRFAVSDTGVGIDDAQAASLFQAFSQADQSSTRRYGGTGLGLAISRELVGRMGGEIGAESRDGGGSRFWFTAQLPAAVAAAAAGGADRASAEEWVLLAEDNEINRTVAGALLSRRGFRTEIAADGREAVAMASAREYAAILMDCQMPELDGYEATRRIRELEHGHHAPIIAMTAHAMPGDRERCLAAGMDDYLAKPVRVEALDRVIERWLPGHQPSARDGTDATGADAGSAGALDREDLDHRTISELREALTAEMRATLLATFEESLSKCLAEIAGAARRGDHLELRRVAHLLKGSSATVGARRLGSCCQRLEALSARDGKRIGQAQLDELDLIAAKVCPALREQLLAPALQPCEPPETTDDQSGQEPILDPHDARSRTRHQPDALERPDDS